MSTLCEKDIRHIFSIYYLKIDKTLISNNFDERYMYEPILYAEMHQNYLPASQI